MALSGRASSVEQLPRLHPKRYSELLNDGDGWVPSSTLDVADIGPVDLYLEGKRLLRQAFLIP